MARVPLWPLRMASQNTSRPAPNAETTPMPVIATRGVFNWLLIIASVVKLFRWTGALLFLLSLLSFAVRLRLCACGVPAPDEGTRSATRSLNVAPVHDLRAASQHHGAHRRQGVDHAPGPADAGAQRLRVDRQPVVPRRVLAVAAAARDHLADARPRPGAVRRAGIRRRRSPSPPPASSASGNWPACSSRITPRPIEFKAEGPFAIVRHPIYLGWVLMVFATPVMTTSRLLFAVVSTLYLIAAIPFEERSLLENFPREIQRLPKTDALEADSADLVS